MAMNPMQRRARNAFLVGFAIALLIGAVAVGALLMRIKEANAEIEALESLKKFYLVAGDDIRSGDYVEMTDLTSEQVQTTVDESKVISATDFQIAISDDEVEEVPLIAKINIPKGEIVTKDMLVYEEEQTTPTDRVVEYNMISLPSQLENGDYVDIRFSLPNGQDFTVLTKKKVLGTTSTGIWLVLNELEIELMNNAIVENYIISGSRLYALEYSEPGLQKAAAKTYIASQNVIQIMVNNPNILDEIYAEYEGQVYNLSSFRATAINSELDKYSSNSGSLVATGNDAEEQAVASDRANYVSSLEGTDRIGYNQE